MSWRGPPCPGFVCGEEAQTARGDLHPELGDLEAATWDHTLAISPSLQSRLRPWLQQAPRGAAVMATQGCPEVLLPT